MDAPVKSDKLIRGATGDWEVVIGMEVHAQVNSRAKLFSGAATAFGGEPNSQVSLVDAAMPGMLPVINAACVAQAVRTGLGLKAKINRRSVFDRKNYFYPDLPQGYQISQYQRPIVGEGEVEDEEVWTTSEALPNCLLQGGGMVDMNCGVLKAGNEDTGEVFVIFDQENVSWTVSVVEDSAEFGEEEVFVEGFLYPTLCVPG